jgi:hypothetical protein
MYFLNYIESVYEKFSGFPEFQFHFNKVKESNVKTLLLYEIEKNLKESLQPIQIWSYDLIVRYPPSSWKNVPLNYHIMVLLTYLLSVALLEKGMYNKPMPSYPSFWNKDGDGYYAKKNNNKRKAKEQQEEEDNNGKLIKRQKLNPEKWRGRKRMLELINNESILGKLSENSDGEGLLEMISKYEESLDELSEIINGTDPRYQLFLDYDPSSIILNTIDEMESDETFIIKNLSLLVNKLTDIRILIDELNEKESMVEEERETEAQGFEERKEFMVEEETEEQGGEDQTIYTRITKITNILINTAIVTVFSVIVFSFLFDDPSTIDRKIILDFLQQNIGIVGFDWDDIYSHIKPEGFGIDDEVLKMYLGLFINRLEKGITTIDGVNIKELKEIALGYFDFLKNL